MNAPGIVLSFPAIAGRTYRLRQSNILGTWANASQALITGDGTIRNFVIPVGSAQSYFYRVVPAVP